MHAYKASNGLIIESKYELEKSDVVVVKKDGVNKAEFLYVEHIFKDGTIELSQYDIKTVTIKY